MPLLGPDYSTRRWLKVGLIFGFTRLGQRYPEQRILPAAK
jgi:hypothetical protein